MRISDWSSDVCSSDIIPVPAGSSAKHLRLGHRDIHHLRSPTVPGNANAVGIDNAFACQLGDRVFKTIDAVDPDQLAQLFGTECAWADRKSTRLNSSH